MATDPVLFLEIAINPDFVALQESVRVRQNPLSRIHIEVEEEKEEDSFIPLSPLGRMDLRGYDDREEDEGDNGMILDASPPRSVASVNSFDTRNQDFIRFS